MAEGVKALAREQGRLRDGRAKKDRMPTDAMLILVARGMFLVPCREAPNGGAHIWMEWLGYLPSPKNSGGYWRGTFVRAGLRSWC